VFTTILTSATGGAPDLLITAAYHRGYCLRMAGQLDAAAASYDEGRLLALSYGSEARVLEADVSHAALALHRGNLPAAERLLAGVIAHPDPATARHVLARAFHDRSHPAARRGRPEDVIVDEYRALPLYESAADKDRVLGDIATSLGEAGYHEAAWDAQLLVAATAQEQEARWIATANLIELAAWRDNERLFNRYREELTGVELPAWISGYFHLHVGEGYLRFGHRDLALAALRRAVDVCTRAQLHELRFRAEDLITQIDRAPAPVRSAVPPTDGEIAEVIGAVRTMRDLAGVSEG